MLGRGWTWIRAHVSPLQAASLVMVALLLAGAFALGAILGNARPTASPAGSIPPPAARPPLDGRRLGTVGAIERVEGDRIDLRDPGSGQRWSVRANPNTIVQSGPRERIPVHDLRPGQRVFVVGVPNTPDINQPAADPEWNAQFIGVVMGQPQRYVLPPAIRCADCRD